MDVSTQLSIVIKIIYFAMIELFIKVVCIKKRQNYTKHAGYCKEITGENTKMQ